ncbi:MAG: MMPL family transporter [Erysipelatoclostridium sp.]|nr:MMPL family transporter [Thomasclavelia sp.]
MEDEFGELNSLQLMITDISFEEANQIYQDLSKIENIKNISFGDTENYYHDDKALYIINVDSLNDEETQNLKENIIEVVDSQEYYLYDAFSEDVVGGMNLILALAVIVIVLVLLLTSKSYFDIVLAFIIFGLSILINMGTNFIFGEISYITESIAVILQLALSLDYLIIFLNHYHKEIGDTTDTVLAVKKTVSKSIPEIFASSLTTIAGLMALVFMQLKIGADIGIVLSKGIICSLFTVILVLPALLLLFSKVLYKTKHKSLIPDTMKLSKFIVNKKNIILPIFIVLLILSICLIPKYDYVYDIHSVRAHQASENTAAQLKIEEEFGSNNRLVLLIPNQEKDYAKELFLTQDLKKLANVSDITSFGSMEVGENIYLGSSLTREEFAQFSGIDLKVSAQLYQYYATLKELDSKDLKITLVDLIYFLHEHEEELHLT